MAMDEISELQVPSVENAMLFMWVTNVHIYEAKQVIDSWGFGYVTNFCWVKPSIGCARAVLML